jgi:xanthine/uracil/vitamin C permease (AzgA family)
MSASLPALLALLGLFLIAVLEKAKVKGSVLISIVGITVVYYLVTGTVPSFDMSQVGQAFKDFGTIPCNPIFKEDEIVGEAFALAFHKSLRSGVVNLIDEFGKHTFF